MQNRARVPTHTAQLLSQRASLMRAVPSRSEALLWSRLRAVQLGTPFKRQVIVGGRFIVDFIAPARRLIVEVDGGYHVSRTRADASRERKLRRLGYRALRLPADLVEQHLEEAVALVRSALAEPRP